MLQNPEFKKSTVLLILYMGIFIVLVCGGGWFLQQQIKTTYVENNAALVGKVLENHPELEEELIPIITKEAGKRQVQKGIHILEKYGYTSKLSAPFLPSLYKTEKEIAMFYIGLFVIFLAVIGVHHYTQYRKIYCNVQKLMQFSNYVLEGNYHISIPETREGEFSKLTHSFNRMRLVIQKNIEDLQKEKQFLVNLMSDISHQLKTPLASLTMYTEIMTERTLTKEQQKMFLENSNQQLERMNWLIQSLLKLAKLDVGAIQFQKKVQPLQQTVIESVHMLKGIAAQREVEIIMKTEKVFLMSHDKDWLMEALLNIIKNAIEHTGPHKHVYVELEENTVAYKIHIRDEGEGIAESEVHNIFKRFYKGKENKKSGSVGIGLSLSQSIVEGHQGYIDVKSKRGEGTVFTLVFPKIATEKAI